MATFNRGQDSSLRLAAFEWLSSLVASHGEVLPRSALARGFLFDSHRIHVVGPQGIFKPAVMGAPISITTSPNGPYTDGFDASDRLRYRYRGTNRQHPDNRGLSFAMENRLPLAYFHGILPGRYLAIWPVYVIQDLPGSLTFVVEVDDGANVDVISNPQDDTDLDAAGRRRYVTALTRRRVHQTAFRARVLRAYRHQCAICRLGHEELLEAAHITPDSEQGGEPVVSNGLSLCRLHHGAFDRFFLGVRPDLVIQVRQDVLAETDGPTLRYAIQGLHGQQIALPRKRNERPSPDRLEERYERFLAAVA